MKLKTNSSGLIIAVFSAMIFGLYPPSAKMAYAEGANIPFVVIITTFVRALSLSIFCLLTNKPVIPNCSEFWPMIRAGFFQAVSIFGIIGSLAFLPGPVTIIIMFTHTIMLLFFMAYMGEIKLTATAVISTLSALFGVSLVVDVWSNAGNLSLIGISLALLAAIATMSRLYVFEKQVKLDAPAVVGARVFVVAFLFTLILVFFKTPIPPSTVLGELWLLLSCASLAIGTFGMFYGIFLLGSFNFSLIIKLEPVFTALFSILIMNEYLSASQYLGMILVILSLVGYQYFDYLRSKEFI